MMQQSSLEAWKSSQDEISALRDKVLWGFQRYGNCTDSELAHYLGFSHRQVVSPRRNELVKLGLVVEKYKRECSRSGKLAIVWGAVC